MIVRGGPNIRVRQIGRHVLVSGQRPRGLDHAWRGLLSGDTLRISLGLVNGLEPYIGTRLMSGRRSDGTEDPAGVPTIRVSPGAFNAAGRSWVCVRVVTTEQGGFSDSTYSPATLSIVQTSSLRDGNDRVGLHPVLILRLVGGRVEMRQHSYFDLQHSVVMRDGRLFHFFCPA